MSCSSVDCDSNLIVYGGTEYDRYFKCESILNKWFGDDLMDNQFNVYSEKNKFEINIKNSRGDDKLINIRKSKYHLELCLYHYHSNCINEIMRKKGRANFFLIKVLVINVKNDVDKHKDFEKSWRHHLKCNPIQIIILSNNNIPFLEEEKANICNSQQTSKNVIKCFKRILIVTPFCTINGLRTNSPLNAISDEILVKIFNQIDCVKSRLRCESVCRRWRKMMLKSWEEMKSLEKFAHKEINKNIISSAQYYEMIFRKCPQLESFDGKQMRNCFSTNEGNKKLVMHCKKLKELKIDTPIDFGLFIPLASQLESLSIHMGSRKEYNITKANQFFSLAKNLIKANIFISATSTYQKETFFSLFKNLKKLKLKLGESDYYEQSNILHDFVANNKHSLEVLSIRCYYNAVAHIGHFTNLIALKIVVFEFYGENYTSDLEKSLLHLIKLKSLYICNEAEQDLFDTNIMIRLLVNNPHLKELKLATNVVDFDDEDLHELNSKGIDLCVCRESENGSFWMLKSQTTTAT